MYRVKSKPFQRMQYFYCRKRKRFTTSEKDFEIYINCIFRFWVCTYLYVTVNWKWNKGKEERGEEREKKWARKETLRESYINYSSLNTHFGLNLSVFNYLKWWQQSAGHSICWMYVDNCMHGECYLKPRYALNRSWMIKSEPNGQSPDWIIAKRDR